jgi:hypothetical protein
LNREAVAGSFDTRAYTLVTGAFAEVAVVALAKDANAGIIFFAGLGSILICIL